MIIKQKEKEQRSLVYRIVTNYYLWLIICFILLYAGIWQCGFVLAFMLWYKILDVIVRVFKKIGKMTDKNDS